MTRTICLGTLGMFQKETKSSDALQEISTNWSQARARSQVRMISIRISPSPIMLRETSSTKRANQSTQGKLPFQNIGFQTVAENEPFLILTFHKASKSSTPTNQEAERPGSAVQPMSWRLSTCQAMLGTFLRLQVRTFTANRSPRQPPKPLTANLPRVSPTQSRRHSPPKTPLNSTKRTSEPSKRRWTQQKSRTLTMPTISTMLSKWLWISNVGLQVPRNWDHREESLYGPANRWISGCSELV